MITFTQEITARNDQQDIFDYMQRVEKHADEEWKTVAMGIIKDLCQNRTEWTADDVWEALSHHTAKTHEPRAVGALIVNASKMGLCKSTGRYVQSRLPIRHKRPVCVWESIRNNV